MAVSGLARRLPGWWYQRRLVVALWPLLPVSWLFGVLGRLRRGLYRCGVLRTDHLPVPVVVVGNLTIGGSGKTPLVLWLVSRLRDQGWFPGIISRGYGGSGESVRPVLPSSPCSVVGDEPLMLARRSGVPVFVGRDRFAVGQALLAAHPECNVIVADDGLQHYRLQRAVELVVFDGRGALVTAVCCRLAPCASPCGVCRGSAAVIWNGLPEARAATAARHLPQFDMQLVGERFVAAAGARRVCDAPSLMNANCTRWPGSAIRSDFSGSCEPWDSISKSIPFRITIRTRAGDLAFAQDGVLLMTEKGCGKMRPSATGEAWVLPVEAVIGTPPGHAGLFETILEKLHGRTPA
jgi:tetraacyldisaccharide 4'-kinase